MSDLAPFLQTLRDRLAITEVVRPHVKLTRKGREYLGLCPFHKEKSPSFTVSDEKGFYHCFGCGAHGDIFTFVMDKQNMPFMESVELLANLVGLEVPKRPSPSAETPVQPKPDSGLYEAMEAACCWYQQQLGLTQGTLARSYLEQRGILPETITRFRLGYAPEQGLQAALQKKGFSEALLLEAGLIGRAEERRSTYDRFRNRLMFPIWDGKGRVIAFGGRILKDGEPKYLNSPETPTFSKGRTLYAHHFALPVARQRDAGEKPLIVVEGYMDVIAMHQAGFKTAVAPLGTALTPDQMALLWRTTHDPVLCFDGDAAGLRAAHRAAERALSVLKVGQTLRFCFLTAGEDPDSLIRSGQTRELERILNSPQPLVDVLWSIFMQNRNLSTPDQKAVAQRDLEQLAKEIIDPDVRHFYRQDLMDRLFRLTGRKSRPNQGQYQRLPGGKRYPLEQAPLAVPRVLPNKNQSGYKILLATLINHPTLIEDAAEYFMALNEGMGKYDGLRQTVLSLIAETPHLDARELQDLLKQKGFGPLLEEVLAPQVYSLAPFARASANKEDALAGWKEVWERTVTSHHLAAEVSRTAEMARDELTPETWDRLAKMVLKKDEKKGESHNG